jgi:hypothetical protein
MNLNGPITGDKELDSYLFHLKTTIEDTLFIINQMRNQSASGTFNTADNKRVTVDRGLITKVEPL